MSTNCQVTKKYVFKKLNAIRWKPPATNFTKPEVFITGSWDDEANCVSVWRCTSEGDPTEVQEVAHSGDVTDITYINRDLFAVSSHLGSVSLYQHRENDTIEKSQAWDKCHSLKTDCSASCTAMATNGTLLASVGEDARLLIHTPGEKDVSRVIGSGTDSSDYAVCFTKSSQILTGNMQGHLRLFDIRQKGSDPVSSIISNDQEYVVGLSCHPSQQHVVSAAGEAGTLTLWDMRNTAQPFSCITAHSAPMTEARFHPSAPDHLFSCGLDGQLIHWDASESTNKHDKSSGHISSWLHPGISRGDISTTTLLPPSPLPLNSLDVQADSLLAVGDNEAIYLLRNVILY